MTDRLDPGYLNVPPTGTVSELFPDFSDPDFLFWVPVRGEKDFPLFPIPPSDLPEGSTSRDCCVLFTRKEKAEEFILSRRDFVGQEGELNLRELTKEQLGRWILGNYRARVEILYMDLKYLSFLHSWLPFCYKLFPPEE